MASTVNIVNTVIMVSIPLMNKIDAHIHILPSLDDGSKNEMQSYRMLKCSQENGMETVIATPHFYPDSLTPTDFVIQRELSLNKLRTYIDAKGNPPLPQIKLAAEVLLGFETSKLSDLNKLAIENTRYILIEMPYSYWEEWVYESIEAIIYQHKLIPIIAHVERYVPMQRNLESIFRLMSIEGVLGQMNTYSLLDRHTSSLCFKLLQNNMVHLLGSDAHRTSHLTDVSKAYQLIEKKQGITMINFLNQNSHLILENKPITGLKEPIPFKKIWGHFYK